MRTCKNYVCLLAKVETITNAYIYQDLGADGAREIQKKSINHPVVDIGANTKYVLLATEKFFRIYKLDTLEIVLKGWTSYKIIKARINE